MSLTDLENSSEYEKKAATNNLGKGKIKSQNQAPSDTRTDDFDSNIDGKGMVSPTTNGTGS